MTAGALATAVLVRLGEVSNRTFVLPLVVFYPTSRCNSRCVSCEWWRETGAGDLSFEEIGQLADAVARLGTRLVVFSGGEPLLRPDVFAAAALFRRHDIDVHLLTSGVLLERFVDRVAEQFTRVTVSLDATTEALYERVRGVSALGIVAAGVKRLRSIAPAVPVTARSTLHRANFRELPRLIEYARTLGVDGISFLPADVSSYAFGRHHLPDSDTLALAAEEIEEFEDIVERAIAVYRDDFESGFVAESPQKLRRLPRYYKALRGGAAFPGVDCNAPWTSVVVEANGAVRPCFFHAPIGNIRVTPLSTIVTESLRTFRRGFDVAEDPVCARCVCSLKTSLRHAPWLS